MSKRQCRAQLCDVVPVAVLVFPKAAASLRMEQQSSENNMADMYRDCIALEQKLREEMKHKNFYEANVRSVRAQLRSAYERILFVDYVGAQV